MKRRILIKMYSVRGINSGKAFLFVSHIDLHLFLLLGDPAEPIRVRYSWIRVLKPDQRQTRPNELIFSILFYLNEVHLVYSRFFWRKLMIFLRICLVHWRVVFIPILILFTWFYLISFIMNNSLIFPYINFL